MSSNINPYNIDGTYPIAGQDNDSQGFRDNFTNIRNNFVFSKEELQDLQDKVVLKAALSGTDLDNTMEGVQLNGPQLKNWTQATVSQSNVGSGTGGDVAVDFAQGTFQYIKPDTSITLTINNWPSLSGVGANGYGVLRLWFEITDTAYTVTLPEEVTIGVSDIANYDSATHTISFDAPGDYVFDLSSNDGGSSFLIFDLKRNRASFRDNQIYFNPDVSPTLFIGFGDGLPTAQAIGNGLDTIAAAGSMTSAGITTGANVTYTTPIGGYTVLGLQGNILENTLAPVASNDYVGYFNAYAYTGNVATGTSNTFVQTSTIGMFATGANVDYGLGGNVAVFTKLDGSNDLVQAVGIENNQSVNFFGNVVLDNTSKYVPSTAASAGTAGQIAWDASFIYICTATDTWKRVGISTW